MSANTTLEGETEGARALRELRRLSPRDGAKRLVASAGETPPGETLEAKLLAIIEESGRLTMVSAAEALDATAFAVELADESGLDFPRARARRARARALAYAGRFDEALVLCSEAITIAMRCNRQDEAGRARLASMHALTEMGRLDEAIDAGRAARQVFEAMGEHALAARADNNLGIVFQRRDQPAAAIECFDRARPLLASDPVALGHLENSRGSALLALNDFAGAEAAFEAAMTAFERAGADLTAAIAEGNLGDLAMRRGRLREAMRYFERAMRRFERCNSPGHLARLIAEQAEAKAMIGLAGEALADYEKALAQLEACGMPLEANRARTAMGYALCRLGRFSQAESALAAAAMGFEELHHTTLRARVDLVRAELAARSGDARRVRGARAVALRALAALESRPVDAAAARLLLGRLAMLLDEPVVAECELRAAAAMADALGIAPLACDVHHALGRLDRSRGRLDSAIEHLSRAVQFAERIRSSIQAERFRTAFLGGRAALYDELVSSLIGRDDERSIEQAFEVAERCKSRTLLDRLGAGSDDDAAASEADDESGGRELTARMNRLSEELNAMYSRLGDERFPAGDAGAMRAWRGRIRELESQLEEVESRLASAHGAATLHAPGATFAQVRAVLRPGEAIVEYFTIGVDLIAFVVQADHPAIVRRLPAIGASMIEERLERLQFQIDRALRRLTAGSTTAAGSDRALRDTQRELGWLYEQLIAPIADSLSGVTDLIVVPHGPLHALPFHALWDDANGEYLDERFTIRSAPSASVLVRPRGDSAKGMNAPDAKRNECNRALVVAVPDDVVPNVLREGRDLAAMLNASLLETGEATIANVRRAALDRDVLHFACHGRFDAAAPHGSGLRLADGWLTLRQVCDLRLNARLVALSACETGLSRVESGDEVLGLQRAFLAAGARSVLMTLWRVPDETTADFGRLFHFAWHTDGASPSVAEAARHARAALRQDHPHPALWAPFAVAGGER